MSRVPAIITLACIGTALHGAALAARCDPAGAHAAALAATYAAADVACPCDAAPTHAAHVACATAVVKARVAAVLLPATCRKAARRRAQMSVCGSPGAVVCCRTDARGRVKGRIASSAERCVAPSGGAACISPLDTVPDGCSASGCVRCGDGILDPEEQCDPPGADRCLPGCRFAVCGDGVMEGGEACEPPGSAGCTGSCTLGTCAAPPAGEQTVACLEQFDTEVGVAAGAGGVLAVWRPVVGPGASRVVGRRFDTGLTPLDPLPLTIGVPPVDPLDARPFFLAGALAAGDAGGWFVGWNASRPPVYEGYVARLEAAGSVLPPVQLFSAISVGQCGTYVFGPTSVASGGDGRALVSWTTAAGCVLGGLFYAHHFAAATDAGGHVELSGLGGIGSTSIPPSSPEVVGDVVDLAGNGIDDTAVAGRALYDPFSGQLLDRGTFAWGLPTVAAPTRLADLPTGIGQGPVVASGGPSGAFLTAWTTTTPSPTTRELRAVRFTSGGPLDPPAGLLLGTTPAPIRALDVAYGDGVWLVVWMASPTPGTFEIHGVAVRPDGTLVDAVPRLLASGVADRALSLTGDAGGFTLAFVRPAGPGLLGVNLRAVAGE